MSNLSGKRRPQIAALGYYGFRNLGDEAVLAGIRTALGQKIGDIDLLVLSNDPEATVRLHPGVRAADRWKWRDAASALRGTDLFVLGGGSLLQDATSARSVLWYALMATLARRRSRRVIWWGQGIGPLKSGTSRRLVRWIANQADALTVRDTDSAALLQAVGVRREVTVVADPAFALEPERADNRSPAAGAILLALRSWRGDGWVGEDGLRPLLQATAGYSVAALPMHLPGDREFVERLPGCSPSVVRTLDWGTDGVTVERTLGWVASAQAVVAMRLHALIFAARCGVPFVALSYDPKVDALARAAKQEDALVPVESLNQERLNAALMRIFQSSDARRETLRGFAAEQGRLALRPGEIAADLLG